MNMLVDDVEKLTKVNLQEQSFLLRYLGRLTVVSRIEIMHQHRRILFLSKEKDQGYNIELLSYASLILTLKASFENRKNLESLNFSDMTLEEIEHVSLKKIEIFMEKEFKRSKPKKEKILRHWAEIKVLKNRGASFQTISNYLAKKRHVTCARSTLHKLWTELENQEKENING